MFRRIVLLSLLMTILTMLMILVGMVAGRTLNTKAALVTAFGVSQRDNSYTLLLSDLDNGVNLPIAPPVRLVGNISLSPDGRYAVIVNGFRVISLTVFDLFTGENYGFPQRFEIGETAWIPNWSPDGERLLFTMTTDFNGLEQTGVYLLDIKTARVQLVQNNVPMGVWSPDGRKIALNARGVVSVIDVEADLLTITPEPEAEVEIEPELQPLAPELPIIREITWSPDSTQLAFIGQMNRQEQVYVVDVADVSESVGESSGQLNNLSGNLSSVRQLVWSPDGRYVGYVAGGFDDSLGYVVDTQRAEPQVFRVAADVQTNIDALRWSTDGEQVVLLASTIGGTTLQSQLFVAESRSPDSVRLLSENAGLPIWSPEGGQIAYQTWEHVQGRYSSMIYLADPIHMTQPAPIVEPGGDGVRATWSSDGRWLTYLRQDGQNSRLYQVNAATRAGRFRSPPGYYVLNFVFQE